MKTRTITLKGDKFFDHLSWEKFVTGENSSDEKLKRMKKILTIGMSELTYRQRDCLQKYYFDNKTVKEISEDLCIRPTTVYKHLKKAHDRLKKCAKYLQKRSRAK